MGMNKHVYRGYTVGNCRFPGSLTRRQENTVSNSITLSYIRPCENAETVLSRGLLTTQYEDLPSKCDIYIQVALLCDEA